MKQFKGFLPLAILFWISTSAYGQIVKKMAPTHWWVGMQRAEVQVLIYGPEIASNEVTLNKYEGVILKKVNKVENPNYLFLDLVILNNAKPGKLQFDLFKNGEKNTFYYELKARSGFQPAALSQADFIYLLMPDRFSNGDYSNDAYSFMADSVVDRSNPWARHGGDLKGVQNHLDYFKELGVTALWLNPVIENDQPQTNEGGTFRSAYHGYGFTDHYEVDRRLGGNKAYKELIEQAHKKGIKIIQDAVYNHCGINHWILKDMPMKNWLHTWEEDFVPTNFKDQSLLDPNASIYDKERTEKGWFMPFLPDLNHENVFVRNYLLQHALWTVEEFQIDAWRIDTYFYNNLEFMNEINAALLAEYPNMLLFGESWVNSVPNQAAFVESNIQLPLNSNLPSSVDFTLYFAINAALNEKFGWNEGVNKLYQTLGQDYLYKFPEKMVTFLDNHDLDRFKSVIGEDARKFKLGIVWLMTLRGIPQIYYGTEWGAKNFKNPTDAEVRKDFPGGWKEDKVNKFKKTGRSLEEEEVFSLVKNLAAFRAKTKAISEGKFTQFQPFGNGIYAYFRHHEEEVVLVISNTSEEKQTIETSRFAEFFKGKTSALNILNQKKINDLTKLTIEPYGVMVLQLKK